MDYKGLGSRIRAVRRKLSLTQEELAEQVGISTSFMGHIERGTRVASLDTLMDICTALSVTPEYLLYPSTEASLSDLLPDISLTESNELRQALSLALASMVSHDQN
ncbi:MAG: helix-turn-helix transcriptional regulator [Clostridia bacterium]|nr:helix-turn-helix transcriptional regulator [Clostridia bacterium]